MPRSRKALHLHTLTVQKLIDQLTEFRNNNVGMSGAPVWIQMPDDIHGISELVAEPGCTGPMLIIHPEEE